MSVIEVNQMDKPLSQRNGKVDLLKFLFSVTVAIYHFNATVEYPNEILNTAYIAVEFFFMVSGYFMAKSLSKFENRKNIDVLKESLIFMKKKYFSIFPYHVYAYVLTIALWIPYFELSIKSWLIKVFNSIPSFFLLKMFGFNISSWLMAEWYLSSMLIVMFILTPIIIKYRKLFTYYFAPILSLAFIAVVFKKCHTLNVFVLKDNLVWLGNIRAFAEIAIGCIIYEVTEKGIFDKLDRKVLMLAEFTCYLITFLYIFKDYELSLEPSVFFILTLGVALTFDKKTSVKFLNNKFVSFLGKFSLAVYLCHPAARYCTTKNEWIYGGYYSQMIIFLIYTFLISLTCILAVDLLKKNFSRTTSAGNTNTINKQI